MTIDESITLLKFNNKHIADLKNDDLQQLAEWLEELKAYRSSIFSGDMTRKMLKEEYNKAIDDYMNKINESNQGHWRPTRYEHGEVVSETMSYDIGTIRLIAKQLKEMESESE